MSTLYDNTRSVVSTTPIDLWYLWKSSSDSRNVMSYHPTISTIQCYPSEAIAVSSCFLYTLLLVPGLTWNCRKPYHLATSSMKSTNNTISQHPTVPTPSFILTYRLFSI